MDNFDFGDRNSSVDPGDIPAIIFRIDSRGLLCIQIAVVRFDFEMGQGLLAGFIETLIVDLDLDLAESYEPSNGGRGCFDPWVGGLIGSLGSIG